MEKRYVTKTGKAQDGDITKLCGENVWWSPRMKADAIRDIESGACEYWVPWNTGETKIRVVNGAKGKYLRTDRDQTPNNNLLELPNC